METDNSKEICDLILELTLNGKINNFLDLESFLKHIFIGVEVGEYGFKGYHSEYLFPNKYGAYTTKKLGSGVYQIKFNSNQREKPTGSTMFPKSISPKELVYTIINNLNPNDYKSKYVEINYKNFIIEVHLAENKIFCAMPKNTFYPQA